MAVPDSAEQSMHMIESLERHTAHVSLKEDFRGDFRVLDVASGRAQDSDHIVSKRVDGNLEDWRFFTLPPIFAVPDAAVTNLSTAAAVEFQAVTNR